MADEQKTEKKPQKKKKSIIRPILLTIIILLLVFSLTLEFFGGKAIRLGVETAGSKTLKVKVTVEDIKLSPLAGSLSIQNLVVANPEGYQNPTLLELGSVKVNLQTTSLLSKIVNIEEIKLDGMVLTIEQKGTTNNLKQILDSLPKAEDKPTDKDPEEKTKDKKPGKKLHIDTLEITNVTIRAKLLPVPGKSGTIEFTLPPIKMTDIGGKDEEPVGMAELIRKIMDAIVEAVAKNGTKFLPEDITGPMGDFLGKTSEQLKDLSDGTSDATKEAIEKTKDLGKDLTEGLKGLFKKKE